MTPLRSTGKGIVQWTLPARLVIVPAKLPEQERQYPLSGIMPVLINFIDIEPGF
jgi:hypothetical protein